jgi:multisubunit Na+/H+ antiporter MnhC subunit
MEFLNFVLIFVIGWLVLAKPEKERLAFALLVVSALLMAFLFFVGTRTSVVPPVNL